MTKPACLAPPGCPAEHWILAKKVAVGGADDQHGGAPGDLQLVQQVRHALRLGLRQQGDQLPTAREVVARLAINPNTVHKAYRELERDGLVGVSPGRARLWSGR